MAAVGDLSALARDELGAIKVPKGANRVKYNTAYCGREISGDSCPWCYVFLRWLFREVRAPEPFFRRRKTASHGTLASYARQHGLFASGGYRAGAWYSCGSVAQTATPTAGRCSGRIGRCGMRGSPRRIIPRPGKDLGGGAGHPVRRQFGAKAVPEFLHPGTDHNIFIPVGVPNWEVAGGRQMPPQRTKRPDRLLCSE